MSDPEDGAGRDGPSDDSVDDDPFHYPAAEQSDDEPATATDSTDDEAATDDEPEADDPNAETPSSGPSRGRASRADSPGSDASRDDRSGEPVGRAENGFTGEPPGRDRSTESEQRSGGLTGFLTADSGAAVYLRDVFTSVAAVLLVGALLFGVSGIWPPMVAVESGSMEPNMNVGDLVFVVDNERFVPDDAVPHDGETTGVVPADVAAEVNHKEFGEHGDVIVFMPDGSERQTPVIHRAMLFVEEGENWYDRADQGAVGSADDCEELDYCPAPHAGFITKGDNEQSNSNYDQVSGLSGPVHPDWVVGTAEVKIPYLGYVRLMFANQMVVPMDSGTVTQPTVAAAAGPQERTAGATAATGARNVRPVA